jgi:hypothetical protein
MCKGTHKPIDPAVVLCVGQGQFLGLPESSFWNFRLCLNLKRLSLRFSAYLCSSLRSPLVFNAEAAKVRREPAETKLIRHY